MVSLSMAVDLLTLLYNMKNGILKVDFAIPAVIASSHAVNTFLLLVVVPNILAFNLYLAAFSEK